MRTLRQRKDQVIGRGIPQEIIQAVKVINVRTEMKILLIPAAFPWGGEVGSIGFLSQ